MYVSYSLNPNYAVNIHIFTFNYFFRQLVVLTVAMDEQLNNYIENSTRTQTVPVKM